MEDIKKRLEFNNTAVKVQAVNKLLELVINKIEETKKSLSDKHAESPAEVLLFDKCTDLDQVVSTTCCRAVLYLIRNNFIPFNDALRKLLNLTPTAKNVNSISAAICDLLLLELVAMVEKSGSYTCPYNIRDPTHPLITVVASRPDSWTAVQVQLSRLFAIKDDRISNHLVPMLRPLIQFILVEPTQTLQFAPLRVSLVTSLIQAASGSDVWRVHRLLIDAIAKCPLKTPQNLSEISHHLTCLMQNIVITLKMTPDLSETSSDLRQETVESSVVVVLEFCTQVNYQATDVSCLLELVLRVCEHCPRCLTSEVCFQYLIQLLPVLTGQALITCLKIALAWLNFYSDHNNTLVAMIMLPVLNIIATPAVTKEKTSSHQVLATKVFTLVAGHLVHNPVGGSDENVTCERTFPVISTEAYVNQSFLLLATSFSKSRGRVRDWLSSNQSAASFPSRIPYQMTCLISALLIIDNDPIVISMCLNLLELIVKQDNSQSPSVLPMLLYRISHVTDPDSKLMVLQSIPKMVTHKFAVSPVLRTLQILGNNVNMKSVAMTMMSSLWKQQDRCFPYLQQLVLDTAQSSGTHCRHVDEVTTAQAACIKDICTLRPHQHGADVLPSLSHIITHCSSNSQSTAVALAMDGLYVLCQTEVIDIQTVWSVLAPKLSTDKRPLVLASTCHFLSLVPELDVDTKQYQEFRRSAVELLWTYTQFPLISVSASAYRALASFSKLDFTPSLLPSKLQTSLELTLPAAPEDDLEKAPDVIPGYCYVRLLKTLDPAVYNDFEVFLTSLIKQEISELPRNRPKTKPTTTDTSRQQNKATATIPTLLQVEFERNKTPGLRGSLSVGVLITYDPLVSTDRHGKPKPQQVIQRGRHFHQMLYSLIHEVPLQAGDWHQNLCLPEAWIIFMERCYHGYLEGQQMELSQQLERGLATDPDEIDYRQKTAWLWARDKLTDLIKSVSSGSPVSQANCLCALAGLAVAVFSHASSLDDDTLQLADGATEYLNHTHWICVVMETLLCILDHNHVAKLSVLNVCQLQIGEGRAPSSVLAQCGAGLGLSMMVPIMVSTNTDNIYLVLSTLSANLPAVRQRPDHPQLTFYHSLALGRVLGRLFEEHFTETAGAEGMVAVWKALSDLETSCLSDVSHRVGALLGLSICLVSMCSDINIGNRIHTCTIHDKLLVSMETMSQSDNSFEALCLCLAVVAGTGYVNNILTQDIVDQVVAKLYHVQSSNKQTPGVTLALGLICHLLVTANHPTVTDLTIKLFGSWLNALQDEELPTLQRISFLKGITALAGSEDFVYNISSVITSQSGVSLPDLVKVLQHILKYDGDVGLQSSCAWQLGQLWMATAVAGVNQLSAPSNYHHLDDVSVIRALVDVVIDAGKNGPSKVSGEQLVVILRSLVNGSTHPLPPLNWAGVLSPILRLTYGADVECQSLRLAVQQSLVSPNASLLVTSWVLPPIWHSLKHATQLMLLQKLPTLVKTMQFSKLKEFLEGDFIRPFIQLRTADTADDELLDLRLGAMEGLEGALHIADPPQMIQKLLQQTAEAIYDAMPKELDVSLYTSMCRCLAQLPDDIVDHITAKDFASLDLYLKGMFVRCYLVSVGQQPLAWLNPGIEAYTCKTESNPHECLFLLTHCFHGVYVSDGESCSVTSCQKWLLELMGHVKNIAMKIVPVVNLEIHEVLEFLLLVFSTAVCSWSGSSPAQLSLGLIHLAKMNENQMADVIRRRLLEGQEQSTLKSLLMNNLPPSLAVMCDKETWQQMTSKIIDWFLVLYSSPGLDGQEKLKRWIKGCLCAMKHTREFKKMAVWGKVFSLSN